MRERYATHNTVVAFGLEPRLSRLLGDACRVARVKLCEAGDLTDLVAVPNYLVVADLCSRDRSAISTLVDHLRVVDDGVGRVVLLVSPETDVWLPLGGRGWVLHSDLSLSWLTWLVKQRPKRPRRAKKAPLSTPNLYAPTTGDYTGDTYD